MKEKKYTFVSYKDLSDKIDKFEKYVCELDNTEPDRCSEVWQIAQRMSDRLASIANRAIRLEKEFNNK